MSVRERESVCVCVCVDGPPANPDDLDLDGIHTTVNYAALFVLNKAHCFVHFI